MPRKVNVIGVGMVPFQKPGKSEEYYVMAAKAGQAALKDAGVTYDKVQQAFAGYVYGDSTCGQRAVYQLGLTGIPVFNVNNACASGSAAIYLARQAILAGTADCVLALGFEQMAPGALGLVFPDRASPAERFFKALGENTSGGPGKVLTAQLYGIAAREHMQKYGTRAETFGKITVKARRHAAHNPYAVFREPLTLEQVMAAPPACEPLTRYQCCPPTTGAAAALLCSERYAKQHGLNLAVAIAAQAFKTDLPSAFDSGSAMQVVGYDMTRATAREAYEAAGLGPEDADVVELHDCFTANELFSYEALGLTAEGTAERFIEDGDNTYGGRHVVNPSGGLLAKGHPIGATGLAQCCELVWQLRGQAGARQAENARLAVQHNLGLGGACAVTVYQRQ